MPSRVSLWLLATAAFAGDTYYVESGDAAAWAEVLSPFGLTASGQPAGLLISEGATGAVKDSGRRVTVRSVIALARPSLEIIWEKEASVPVFELPAAAKILMRERWSGAPLVAGWTAQKRIHLWTAVSPGPQGYNRFPYLPQALAELGWDPPHRGNRLWAFFDSGYRARADFDYLARRWRQGGIAGLHVAAWHYFDGDPAKAAELQRLIEACHRQRILVYAWLELPHVSEKFWHDHPEWREKTALLEDAQLDWRKLMNLRHRPCFDAVAEGVRHMINAFDWDGVNLAELYFESLEGVANPARLTPMNDDIRQEFQAKHGFDPRDIFTGAKRDSVQLFTAYRAELAARMQREWLDVLTGIRKTKTHLDLVWTHIDDRYDPRMRELLGADTSRVIPLLPKYNATLLIEDPATVWHLGPKRYLDISSKYGRNPRLAIDINIVERYQDVYPTKQQTGVELFQLAHYAGQGFERVALYFENSILPLDYPLLSAAAAPIINTQSGKRSAAQPFGVRHSGDVLVDGQLWPVAGQGTVWLPAGAHSIAASTTPPAVRVLDLNAILEKAASPPGAAEFEYRSSARALALVDRGIKLIEVDGKPYPARQWTTPEGVTIELPAGQHKVKLVPAAGDRISTCG